MCLLRRQCLVSKKSLVHPHLGLTSQVLVKPGQYDDQFVSGIGRLADQTYVVGCLSGLHVPYNQASPVPRTLPVRIFQEGQYAIGYRIQGIDAAGCPGALEVLPVSWPVSPSLCPLCIQPPYVIVIPLKCGLSANPDVEAGFQVTDQTVAVNRTRASWDSIERTASTDSAIVSRDNGPSTILCRIMIWAIASTVSYTFATLFPAVQVPIDLFECLNQFRMIVERLGVQQLRLEPSAYRGQPSQPSGDRARPVRPEFLQKACLQMLPCGFLPFRQYRSTLAVQAWSPPIVEALQTTASLSGPA